MQDVAAQVVKLRAKRTRLRTDHDILSGAKARADAAAARSGVRGLVRAAMAVLPKTASNTSGDSSDDSDTEDSAVRSVLAADTGDELSVTAKVLDNTV
jgi:dihydrodipicolinate synthase/N-acetylneuraminate lyase